MRKVTTLGLLFILILVIVYQYYKISEGFDNIVTTAATPVTPVVPIATPATATPPTVPVAVSATPLAVPAAPADSPTEIAKEKLDRASLLRDIQQVVKNELLEQQKLTTASSQPVLNAGIGTSALVSPAMSQGQELSTKREKNCPKDMNEYIRKDSIPCWNCTLDY